MLLAYASFFPTKAEEIKEVFKLIITLVELPKLALQKKFKYCFIRYGFE